VCDVMLFNEAERPLSYLVNKYNNNAANATWSKVLDEASSFTEATQKLNQRFTSSGSLQFIYTSDARLD
jgi:hypothetical protein